MKRFLTIGLLVTLAVLSASAQQRRFCDRDLNRTLTRGTKVIDSSVSTLEGEVRVPVVFAAFQDVPFATPDIEGKWDDMLNKSGFSKNGAAGSVADYFKIQSGGKFKIHFDVFGPVTLPDSMKYYGANKWGDDVNPEEMIHDACLATDADFSPYDWDGNGVIDVVMVVFAGYGENRGGSSDAIWPHKFNIYDDMEVGDLTLYSYACVSELDGRGEMDGYGTFCHEFSHCLGLPDLYPDDKTVFSYFDEWDLMDGGNYANNGWSPPHYSAFERHICGWFDFTELKEATTITDMVSFDEEPLAYIVRNDADKEHYYILENRQQRGFDAYVPGNGLLITLVNNFDGTLSPNSYSSKPQVTLVTADNRTYRESEAFFGTGDQGKYTADGRNRYLSLAAYPYVDGETVNNHLTETSVPAMAFNKPITNITMNDDGHISFDFLKGETAIRSVHSEEVPDAWYDLQGRRLDTKPMRKGIYIYNNKKVAF